MRLIRQIGRIGLIVRAACVLSLLAGVVCAQTFDQRWPQIHGFMVKGATNLVSGGIVTNEPVGGYVQNIGTNTWKIWFPVGGIVTQVVTYTGAVHFLDVSGGLLTMSGLPTSGVNVVELTPATLLTAGFVQQYGTPDGSWLVGLGANPMRLRRDAGGVAIRNYADDEYRDLTCRNLMSDGAIFTLPMATAATAVSGQCYTNASGALYVKP